MHTDFTYTLELYRDDGAVLSQKVVEPNWAPALEWAHFEGIRAGQLAPALVANLADAPFSIEPVWHPTAGQPRVAQFNVAIPGDGTEIRRAIPVSYLYDHVQQAIAVLVRNGELERGDGYRYIVCAFATTETRAAGAAGGGIVVEEIAQPLPLQLSSLENFLLGAVDNGSEPSRGDFPVFIPETVLEETRQLAQRSRDLETGGVLVGLLRHDTAIPEIFVEVTAQIPALHTQAEATKLTFTPDTWAAVRAALALRKRGETMLGWWHYHPDFCRLRNCPLEDRRRCAASSAFFSSEDIALHAALFGRAFNIALLISDSTAAGLSTSLFGWRQGAVMSRGYYNTERSTRDDAQRATA